MSSALLFFFSSAIFFSSLYTSFADDVEGKACTTSSSCGNIHNISYPFYLKDNPANCAGDPNYQLECESNQTVFNLTRKYKVEEILYKQHLMRLVDPGLQSGNCSSRPSLFSYRDASEYGFFTTLYNNSIITFVYCADAVSNDTSYISTALCFNGSSSHPYSYALLGEKPISSLHQNCSRVGSVPILEERIHYNHTYLDIRQTLSMGFYVGWSFSKLPYYSNYYKPECTRFLQSRNCFFKFIKNKFLWMLDIVIKVLTKLEYFLIVRTSIGLLCLLAFLIYKLRRKHLSMDDRIEEFLTNYKNHIPTRYSYWEIWLMTKCFKEKLGQGGFGSVYKGKLRNGHLVAIKMLVGKSKGNGQDFINEVSTIGRIHHVNVVQLIGFCSEGSKRALIYDFMPNGSLDKFIFAQEGMNNNPPLSWEKLYHISKGIANGIEYLHRGCDMRILHFDIKPHNILLDENFTPKVSDFGLAKFYPTDYSIVSVTAARGTIGYIAPELFYRNVGCVSYKSDVYSFGMMLMEIAGRRKNVDPFVENSSRIYFPTWIYEQLDQGRDMDFGDATEEEKEIVKKLAIVALWCIQMKPSDRPSMGKVVEMLEESVELLQMPPKPILTPPPQVLNEDHHPVEADGTQSPDAYESNLTIVDDLSHV